MANAELRYRRIVAKFGTALLTGGGHRLDLEVMAGLVGQVARLRRQRAQVVVVTSGAIAAGRHRLGSRGRLLGKERRAGPQARAGGLPEAEPQARAGRAGQEIVTRQALAAVGQSHLMQAYDELFAWHDLTVAQALLTRQDLADRVGYLNARNTLLALLELGAIPIVNENDVVAVDEIEGAKIGDNDNLSALVAGLVDADLLALLGDTGGLYTADPRHNARAQLIPRVERIDDALAEMAGRPGPGGTGGMATKLQAAKLATAGGADVVIADGREPDVLLRLAGGELLGTWFPAAADPLESRKRWMLSGLAARGQVVIDTGAVRALKEQGKSLLPAGVRGVEGAFQRGDVIYVCDEGEGRVACGIANYSHQEVRAIQGQRSDRIAHILGYHYGEEIVHRNNLVLL